MLLSRLEWAVVHFERGRLGDHREAVSSLASLEHGQLGEKEPFLTVHEPETKSSLVSWSQGGSNSWPHDWRKFAPAANPEVYSSFVWIFFVLFFFFKTRLGVKVVTQKN